MEDYPKNPKNPKYSKNSKLFKLLEQYQTHQSQENFKAVFLELTEGDSMLLMAVENTNLPQNAWIKTQNATPFSSKSLVQIGPLKALLVFTDEDSLRNGSDQDLPYLALPAPKMLQIGEYNQIDQLIINIDTPTMFVLERHQEQANHGAHIKPVHIQETFELIKVEEPISTSLMQNVLFHAQRVGVIEEIYQYTQKTPTQKTTVLGFKLETYSQFAKNSVLELMQELYHQESKKMLMDVFFIETEDLYQRIKNIPQALIYQKSIRYKSFG